MSFPAITAKICLVFAIFWLPKPSFLKKDQTTLHSSSSSSPSFAVDDSQPLMTLRHFLQQSLHLLPPPWRKGASKQASSSSLFHRAPSWPLRLPFPWDSLTWNPWRWQSGGDISLLRRLRSTVWMRWTPIWIGWRVKVGPSYGRRWWRAPVRGSWWIKYENEDCLVLVEVCVELIIKMCNPSQ